MDWAVIQSIGQLLIGGGVIAAFLLHLREGPKALAEARRVTVETGAAQWASLQKEIGRLEGRLEKVEKENEELRERIDRQRGRERTLEHENGVLRAQVEALETRLAALESLFKAHPLSAEMKAALARLDETSPRKRVVK